MQYFYQSNSFPETWPIYHSVKMLQRQHHDNYKWSVAVWVIALEAKLLSETTAHFHVSIDSVKHLYILRLGDGRKYMWRRYGEPSYIYSYY